MKGGNASGSISRTVGTEFGPSRTQVNSLKETSIDFDTEVAFSEKGAKPRLTSARAVVTTNRAAGASEEFA